MKLLLLLIFLSCSSINNPTGSLNSNEIGAQNLPAYRDAISMNLLIMVDLEVMYKKPLNEWEQNIQMLIWKLYKDFNLLVALTSMDNRYDFVYASNKENLTPKGDVPVQKLSEISLTKLVKSPLRKSPGILYTLNKLKFLSSRGFFNPELDTHVLLVSAEDDHDYYSNMSGLKIKDHLQLRIDQLKTINRDIYTGKLEKKKYYNFKKMRLFTVVPGRESCKGNKKRNYRYRLASKEIYETFMGSTNAGVWPDNYDYCNSSLQMIFKNIYNSLKENKNYSL